MKLYNIQLNEEESKEIDSLAIVHGVSPKTILKRALEFWIDLNMDIMNDDDKELFNILMRR